MPETIWFISYELVDGTSVQDFLEASQKAHDEVLSKQKGFISWEVLQQGKIWVDMVRWESMDDAVRGETSGQNSPAAHKFYAFINPESCKTQYYSLEKKY